MNRPQPDAESPHASKRRPLRMPEPIDATPEKIARVCLETRPLKRELEYLKKRPGDD